MHLTHIVICSVSHYKKQIWRCIFRASFWHNFSMQEGVFSLETLILFCTIWYNIILYNKIHYIQCYSVIEWNKIFWKLHNTRPFYFWFFIIVWIFFLAASFPLSIYYISSSNIKLPLCKSLIGLYQTQWPLRPLGYLYIYRLYLIWIHVLYLSFAY